MVILVQILGISYSEQILSETSVNVARDSTFGAAFIVSTSGTTGPDSTVRTAVAVTGNSNIGSAVIMSCRYNNHVSTEHSSTMVDESNKP